MIMRRGAKRRWTTAVVCACRVASPGDVSVVDRGSNGSTSPLAMRAKTRSQSSAANEGRRDHEVAARCADLRPTLTARLEHGTVSDGDGQQRLRQQLSKLDRVGIHLDTNKARPFAKRAIKIVSTPVLTVTTACKVNTCKCTKTLLQLSAL